MCSWISLSKIWSVCKTLIPNPSVPVTSPQINMAEASHSKLYCQHIYKNKISLLVHYLLTQALLGQKSIVFVILHCFDLVVMTILEVIFILDASCQKGFNPSQASMVEQLDLWRLEDTTEAVPLQPTRKQKKSMTRNNNQLNPGPVPSTIVLPAEGHTFRRWVHGRHLVSNYHICLKQHTQGLEATSSGWTPGLTLYIACLQLAYNLRPQLFFSFVIMKSVFYLKQYQHS